MEVRRGYRLFYSITLHLILLRQGLSLTPELDSRHQPLPVLHSSLTTVLGLQAQVTMPYSYTDSGILAQVLMLAQQAFLPTKPSVQFHDFITFNYFV